MNASLAGKVALVMGYAGHGHHEWGDYERNADSLTAIAQGLAASGAAVGMMSTASMSAPMQQAVDDIVESGGKATRTAVNMENRESFESIVESLVAQLGPIDLVVISVVDPGHLTPKPFVEFSEREFMARCEAPLRAVRVALQSAHKALAERGGRIFLLVPTIAINGAEGLAAYCAVGEGARSLAKAAARRWGAQGITVNCLALLPEQLHPAANRPPEATKVPQALDHLPDIRTEIAPLIAMLATAPAIVTGTTIMVDGGNLMSV